MGVVAASALWSRVLGRAAICLPEGQRLPRPPEMDVCLQDWRHCLQASGRAIGGIRTNWLDFLVCGDMRLVISRYCLGHEEIIGFPGWFPRVCPCFHDGLSALTRVLRPYV
jgi:hypothetical protein